MRYPYIVAAGCLTLLLSSPVVAGTTIDLASAPSSTVQSATNEVPLSKPGNGHKKHHHKKDKKDKKDKDGQGQDPTGNQIPLPDEDYRDPGADTPAPTPEPGTMLLLGAAAGAMGLRRRMRNRSR